MGPSAAVSGHQAMRELEVAAVREGLPPPPPQAPTCQHGLPIPGPHPHPPWRNEGTHSAPAPPLWDNLFPCVAMCRRLYWARRSRMSMLNVVSAFVALVQLLPDPLLEQLLLLPQQQLLGHQGGLPAEAGMDLHPANGGGALDPSAAMHTAQEEEEATGGSARGGQQPAAAAGHRSPRRSSGSAGASRQGAAAGERPRHRVGAGVTSAAAAAAKAVTLTEREREALRGLMVRMALDAGRWAGRKGHAKAYMTAPLTRGCHAAPVQHLPVRRSDVGLQPAGTCAGILPRTCCQI